MHSVQFSHSVMSHSLPPNGLQHVRPSCPSPTPGALSNSCPLSQWCHPTISSSVVPFSSCLQSFPASGSLQMSVLRITWPKYWSFTFSISPSNEYSGLISFRVDWLDLLVVQGTLKNLLQHHSSRVSILPCSAFFIVQLSHPYMTTGKTIALTRWTFVGKVISLLSNMLSRLVITLLPRSKRLLISWLQSPSAVIWGPPQIKSVTVSTASPSICQEVMGTGCHDLCFLNVEFYSKLFHSPLWPSSRGSLVPLRFLPLEWYPLPIWGYCYFSWLVILILACDSSSPAFRMMYSDYLIRVTKYSLDVLLSQFWTSPLFHVWF